jgi:hypothetical protein
MMSRARQQTSLIDVGSDPFWERKGEFNGTVFNLAVSARYAAFFSSLGWEWSYGPRPEYEHPDVFMLHGNNRLIRVRVHHTKWSPRCKNVGLAMKENLSVLDQLSRREKEHDTLVVTMEPPFMLDTKKQTGLLGTYISKDWADRPLGEGVNPARVVCKQSAMDVRVYRLMCDFYRHEVLVGKVGLRPDAVVVVPSLNAAWRKACDAVKVI